jgi:hypothetical protein
VISAVRSIAVIGASLWLAARAVEKKDIANGKPKSVINAATNIETSLKTLLFLIVLTSLIWFFSIRDIR